MAEKILKMSPQVSHLLIIPSNANLGDAVRDFADGMRVTYQLTLRQRDYPELSR